jgi:hypothetical protein
LLFEKIWAAAFSLPVQIYAHIHRAGKWPYCEIPCLNETRASDIWCDCSRSRACGFCNSLRRAQAEHPNTAASKRGGTKGEFVDAGELDRARLCCVTEVPSYHAGDINRARACRPAEVRSHGPRWARIDATTAPPAPAQQAIAAAPTPALLAARVAAHQADPATLPSHAESVDVCARYGGHRLDFMRGHHAMWKCVYRTRRQRANVKTTGESVASGR